MKVVKAWSALFLAGACLTLAACGKKPPECADAAASAELRRTMNAWVAEALPARGVRPKEDSGGLIEKYLGTWSFTLSNVKSDGYDEKSKTRSCAGKVAIEIPDTKQSASVDFAYEMQTLEDAKSGAFELRTDNGFKTWSYGLIDPVANHYKVYSVSGTWVGKAECMPTMVQKTAFEKFFGPEAEAGFTVLATEGAWIPDQATQGLPVSVEVSQGNVKMQITDASGKVVTRTAKLEPGGTFKTEPDELSSAVVDAGFLSREGRFHNSGLSVSTKARLKSNATGAEVDGVLTRQCVFSTSKK